MYNVIAKVMEKITKEDVSNFAMSKKITLSTDELDFVYDFVKKNWEQVIKNPTLLNLDLYKNRFTSENFDKIKKLFQEYSAKYQGFLK